MTKAENSGFRRSKIGRQSNDHRAPVADGGKIPRQVSKIQREDLARDQQDSREIERKERVY